MASSSGLNLKSRLQVLETADLQRVHDASLRILEKTGVIFHHDEAVRFLKSKGARAEGQRVYLSGRMVETALEHCPETFRHRARNDERSVTIGEGFVVHPNIGPVFVQDLEKGRRRGSFEDLENFQKLAQASEVVHMAGATPVAPDDVPASERALYMIYAAIKHSDKPLVASCTSALKARQTLELVAMAMGGQGVLEESHVVAVSINPLSPLAFGSEVLETIIEYARRRQPVYVLPCILAGVTGPMSPFGTVLQQNAEILAGATLIQSINEGSPVVYAPASTAAWMRTGGYVTGPPEAFLINTANLQLALDFYHLPTRIMHGMTDSKQVDCQAGYETMQNMLMGMLSGGHILEECLGVLDSIMTTSYEKWIIDEELLSRVLRICQGLDSSEEALAVDVVEETGPGGSYLMHDHTLAHMRETWEPTVSVWDSYSEWEEKGSEDVVQRAARRWRRILEQAPQSLIDPALDAELRGYLKRAGGG